MTALQIKSNEEIKVFLASPFLLRFWRIKIAKVEAGAGL
jgi:hypothetical protein